MKKFQKIVHRIKTKLKPYRRRLVIISIVLLIIAMIIAGILFSQQKWNNYSKKYNQQFNSAKLDIESVILQTSSKSDISTQNKLDDISKLQVKLSNESKSYCNVDSLIKWQSFIGQYSSEIKACTQQRKHIQQILDGVDKVAVYLKADQELAAIISNADSETNKNNQSDKWSQISALWHQASINVSKLADAYQFHDTKTAAISGLNNMADTWDSLSKANDAKNRQQFEDARTNLTQSYAGLKTISDTSTRQVNMIISELNSYLL